VAAFLWIWLLRESDPQGVSAKPKSHICSSLYSDYRMLLTTTIQVAEKTREGLFRIVSELERERGRRVSYDEAITVLIERSKAKDSARLHFRRLYGTLGPDPQAWRELRKLRRGERVRLERIAKTPQ